MRIENKYAPPKTKTNMSGENNGRYSHGKTNHPLYNSWKVIKRKCYNKNAADYLGDGFNVCDEWKNSFNTFFEWAINCSIIFFGYKWASHAK